MKYRLKGLNEYVKKLENLSNSFNATICAENAVTAGSLVVREYTAKELQKLPTDDTPQKVELRKGLRTIQKNFLLREFGISPSEDKRNKINRKSGVAKGRLNYPNSDSYTFAIKLARQLENGTSYMHKNPVFTKASRKARTPCIEAMQRSLTDDITRMMDYNQSKIKRRDI